MVVYAQAMVNIETLCNLYIPATWRVVVSEIFGQRIHRIRPVFHHGMVYAIWSSMTQASALSMIRRATEDRGQGAEVYFANPDEKSAVRRLARKGVVKVRETNERDAGLKVIYASLT